MSPHNKLLKIRVGRWLPAILGLGLLAGASTLLWEVSSAVGKARVRSRSESVVAFTVRPHNPQLPAHVEAIGAPPAFRSAALFHGHLFVAGPHGVVEYDPSGVLLRRFRPGFELPAVSIAAVTVGVLAARAEPDLIIATAGEGWLLFDGRQMVHVRPERPEYRKLSTALFIGGGRVLFGTEKAGVFTYDGRALTLAHPLLADVAVTALAGTDGDVWVGTLDRGVWHWHGGTVDRFDENGGLPDARVMSIAVDGDRAYSGTALGVAEFRGGKYVRTVGSGLFAGALKVRNDTLLVGTLDEKVAEIPLNVRPSPRVGPILKDAPGVVRQFLDVEGVLYALAEDALYAVDDRTGSMRRVLGSDSAQLTDRNVSALAVDGIGRLWVGYFDRGLDILDSKAERVSHVESDRIFCVNRIVHDTAAGITAVATANGLVLFDAAGRQRQILGRADGLIADHVTDVLLNADRLTVATPAGLTFIDPEGSRSLYAFHGLVNNHVYALGASGSQVFAGTLGGVSMLEDGTIRANYTSTNSALTHNWMTAVARVDDEWFAGTYGGGVFHLDARGTWRSFTELPTPIEINPNAMVATDSHVFAGTLTKGLLVYDRRTLRWTAVEAGLPSMNVTALAVAPGVLYVGTDNGIVRMNEQVFPLP